MALSLIALTHFIGDDDDVYGIVDRLLDVLAPGSFLVLSQITGDFDPESAARAVELYKGGGVTLRPRTKAEVARFFDGRELTAPGVGLAAAWHPDLGEPGAEGDDTIPVYSGVARKV